MIPFAVSIDTTGLLKVIAASLIATSALTIVLTTVIVGATKAAETSREGRTAASAAYAALMVLCLLGVAAGIVLGLIVMTSK